VNEYPPLSILPSVVLMAGERLTVQLTPRGRVYPLRVSRYTFFLSRESKTTVPLVDKDCAAPPAVMDIVEVLSVPVSIAASKSMLTTTVVDWPVAFIAGVCLSTIGPADEPPVPPELAPPWDELDSFDMLEGDWEDDEMQVLQDVPDALACREESVSAASPKISSC